MHCYHETESYLIAAAVIAGLSLFFNRAVKQIKAKIVLTKFSSIDDICLK